MRSVGLKALKNKLSEYVRVASGGETVLVTDRDRVVAELAEAVRRGWLTPPTLVGTAAPPRRPVARLDVLLAELATDRADS